MIIEDLNPHKYKLTEEIEDNLHILYAKIMMLYKALPREILSRNTFSVTSGLRSQEQQDKLIAAGKSRAKQSLHVLGAAVDLYDPRSELDEWVSNNVEVIQEIGLWFEHKNYTPNWCHVQIFAPQSGKRFFIP